MYEIHINTILGIRANDQRREILKNKIEKPIISFCIPTYNRASCVEQCVKWILEYPGNNIEVIVSDNASSDNTQESLSRILDPRMKYFRNDKNEGFAYNINRVLNEASGEFCFLISDEDEVTQSGICKLMDIIKNDTNTSIIYGSIIEEDDTYNIKYKPMTYLMGDEALEAVAFRHQYIGGIVIKGEVYREIALNNIKWYKKDCFFPHEYLTFLASKYGNIKMIEEPIIVRHDYANVSYTGTGNTSIFHTPEGVFATFEDRIKIIDEQLDKANQVRDRLFLRNFRLSIYTASIFLYHTTKQSDTAKIHGNEAKKLNINIIIRDFYKKSKNLYRENDIYVSDNFNKEVKKIMTVLRVKCIFKDLCSNA